MRANLCVPLLGALVAAAAGQTGWLPEDPGPAEIARTPDRIELKNRAIEADFAATPVGMRFLGYHSVWDADSHANFNEAFTLTLKDGRMLAATRMPMIGAMRQVSDGKNASLEATLLDPPSGVQVRWKAILLGGTTYVREELAITATKDDVDVTRVTFGDGRSPDYTPIKVVGSVLGSPVTTVNLFFGIESPMAISSPIQLGWRSRVDRKVPLRKGQTATYSAVLGVAPAGQMRRAFLAYLERERPGHTTRSSTTNSWYDLGHGGKYNADECVERINYFGRELVDKRHVKLSSFLFDDGWDDTSTVWKFHSGFPQGFTPLTKAAEKYDADPGIWLSPWGGYGGPHDERMRAGHAAGMEIDADGYALSGPKYYERFRETCLDLVRRYHINQFKFDGTGSPDKQYPGSEFGSDFDAAIALIHDLRQAKPGLFINLTTGTWPSPFWTRYADSIWRGSEDHFFAGVGSWREKWITYRDGHTYRGVVTRGPLYPLNSLMLHGIVYARDGEHLQDDPSNSFVNEVRSYFGSGTQLQEMYITPTLLSKQNWDDLADAAKWSYANRDILVDTHWVGGDPLNLEVYGWASWSPRAGILTLRNPSDKPQEFTFQPDKVFELPKRFHGKWRAHSPYGAESASLEISVDKPHTITLQPFEVRVL